MSDSAMSDSGSTGHRAGRPKRVWQLFHTPFSGWNVLGTLTLISGIAVGVGVPLWQHFWVQRPILSIEMNSVRRESPSCNISIDEVPEFALFKPRLQREFQRQQRELVQNVSTSAATRSRFAPAALTATLDEIADLGAQSKREQED